LQGRSHQIKQMLTPAQKTYLSDWLKKTSPQAWDASEDHFRDLFEA
jgi:Spy/CpxP family protein refolding chaperone